ncbi:MAG: helical backbone metal receptor [Planctomycetales bacterium]|nr:helical backbone metal receptor [Planctomycetales bacterium]
MPCAAVLAAAAGLAAFAARRDARSPAGAPGPPRLVSLHDVPTEILVALGAADRLVGVAEPVDLPEDVTRVLACIPCVAGAEATLARRPDVVLGMGVVAEQDPDFVAALRREGVEVFLPDPATVEDLLGLVREVAARAAVPGHGEALVAQVRAEVGPEGAPPPDPLRIFVYDCGDPPFTAGGRTVLTDLIRRAGGRNVFEDLATDWSHVSWEAAIARAPELVVIHSYAYKGQGDAGDKRRTLSRFPSLGRLPVLVMPLRLSLGGIGSLEGLRRLRAAIKEHAR